MLQKQKKKPIVVLFSILIACTPPVMAAIISFLSHYFKYFIAKDSNVAGLTICADWSEASRTYEISILFTDMASIKCAPPFCECW